MNIPLCPQLRASAPNDPPSYTSRPCAAGGRLRAAPGPGTALPHNTRVGAAGYPGQHRAHMASKNIQKTRLTTHWTKRTQGPKALALTSTFHSIRITVRLENNIGIFRDNCLHACCLTLRTITLIQTSEHTKDHPNQTQ